MQKLKDWKKVAMFYSQITIVDILSYTFHSPVYYSILIAQFSIF